MCSDRMSILTQYSCNMGHTTRVSLWPTFVLILLKWTSWYYQGYSWRFHDILYISYYYSLQCSPPWSSTPPPLDFPSISLVLPLLELTGLPQCCLTAVSGAKNCSTISVRPLGYLMCFILWSHWKNKWFNLLCLIVWKPKVGGQKVFFDEIARWLR